MLYISYVSVVDAYEIHLEDTEGQTENEYKVGKPMKLWQFREKLWDQILNYNTIHRINLFH